MAPPLNATFIHRQTLAGQVRFTTTELGELEAKIASAADRALGIELETFDKLAAAVTAAAASDQGGRRSAGGSRRRRRIGASSRSSATMCGPRSTRSLDFVIEGGRHPVVEQALAGDGGPFVANDCDLSPPPIGRARAHLARSPDRTWRASRPICARTR